MSHSVTYEQICQALVIGKYVCWKGRHSEGFVLGVHDGEYLVMASYGNEYKPFKSGFQQSLALGYVFTIHGQDPEDWAR